jgi:hypothetical protein
MNNLKQFENMTIGELRKLTQQYHAMQTLLEKRDDDVRKLEQANNKSNDVWDLNDFIEMC